MGRRATLGFSVGSALFVLLALPATGAADGGQSGGRRGEFFFQVSTGVGRSDDSDLKIRQSTPAGPTNLTFDDVGWEDHSLSGPSARYTNLRFGYYFKRSPWMGIAVGFLHFKIFAEVGRPVPVNGSYRGQPIDDVQEMNRIVQRYEVANGVNFLPVTFLARHRARRSERFPDGRLRPYVGLGVGPTLLYTQSTVDGRRAGGPYELGNAGLQAIGGLEFRVSRRWTVLAEYKRTYTKINGSIEAGSSRTDLHSNHLTLGGGILF